MTFEEEAIATLRKTAIGRVCMAISNARLQAMMADFPGVAAALHALELDVAKEARSMRVGGGVR